MRVLTIQGTDGVLGYLVLGGVLRWNDDIAEQAVKVTDNFALRMDTAVLFDEVRHMATSEERNRLAREMHDGVAQEIVALGYVVDEIESVSDDTRTRELAASLREEITRVVSELRYSIFDLRHHVTDHRLSGALAEYVRELSTGTGLRVHLSFDESGPELSAAPRPSCCASRRRRSATCAGTPRPRTSGSASPPTASLVDLHIEDDGVGQAVPRDRHWGLQTMSERAARHRRHPDRARTTRRRHRRPPPHRPHHHRPRGERSPMSTTVMLVDDHELIRQGLAKAFERDEEMEIVGQAGSVNEALAAYREPQPRRRRHRPPAARRPRPRDRPRGAQRERLRRAGRADHARR